MNQFYNQDEEVQKAVKAMFDFIEAMNKLDFETSTASIE